MDDARGSRAADGWLVALDVDGTILHEDESLDAVVVDAVRSARDRGHEVMLATGRSWHTTQPVLLALGLSPDYVVCANGAIIMRRQGEVFGDEAPDYVRAHVETFDPTEVLMRIRDHLPDGRFMVELADGRRLFTAGMFDWDLSNAVEVGFDELLGTFATRVVVVSPDHELEDFLGVVERMGLHRVSYAVGWTSWLDIAPDGVNKSTAMERVRGWLGVPRSRILAVGDGRNDIEMLQWAALSGRAVAMGQAPDEVRAAATQLALPVTEAGLAPVLDALP
ncbi:MAG: haloacid dehalogenase [Micrococcales bacterium 73-13]|nr:MAG: haloacid dehalogenase [Micrococcales bacterium 73-13]